MEFRRWIMNSYLKHYQNIVYIFLGILMIILGCGETDYSDENLQTIEQSSTEDITEPVGELTPGERAERLMRIVNYNRTEAYKLAKIQNSYIHLPETSDKIFKRVLGFEEGFAGRLIAAWEGTLFARRMIKQIDNVEFKRYEHFRDTYKARIANGGEQFYFEYIGAYDEIISEYIRIQFTSPNESVEKVLANYHQSLLRGNADMVYPDGF